MNSDDSTRGADRSYASPGVGMTPQFLCAACGRKSGSLGSGIRLVLGARSRVCKADKDKIDARKERA